MEKINMESFSKRRLISRANTTMLVVLAITAFVFVFCGVASKTLISQVAYQNRVISVKKKALSTLQSDLSARDTLVASYKTFVSAPDNVLGGSPTGSGLQDGDNARIVLDALPSKYDFPALITSVEKLVTSQGLRIDGISGTDQEVAQSSQIVAGNSQPVAMPFVVTVSGSYDQMKGLVDAFYKSIRPIQILKMDLSGDETSMSATISAQTYYRPEVSLNISTKVVQ